MGGRRDDTVDKNSSGTGSELYCVLLAHLLNINLMVYFFLLSVFSSHVFC